VNASKVNLTGRKLDQKGYHHYTGYPGGLKSRSARDIRAEDPERMIREAVKGMLPKNRLARQLIKKLRVYGGGDHPHAGQAPQPLP
jgi:large subunit ribosomal protein L13